MLPLCKRLREKRLSLEFLTQWYEMKLSLEAKALFQAIHQEYECQGATIRGDNDYVDALMQLQKRLQNNEAIDRIRSDFEHLKKDHPTP